MVCDTWLEPVVSASTQDRKYIQALNVNLSNFISVKLSGKSNYPIWKIQMLCLINSQKLLHVIHGETLGIPDKYDTLVKGWIFSTTSEQLFKDLIYMENLFDDFFFASAVWNKLANLFDLPKSDRKGVTFGIEFINGAPDLETESSRGVQEIQDTAKNRLKREL
ncbi:hypothetical protein Hanom_Chr15g01403181 [Helianthus anomalus]